MFPQWCVLLFLLSGTQAFMIHNVQRSLCLEEADSGEVQARKCHLDSDWQQWIWEEQSRLVNVATSRCLSSRDVQPLHTQRCPVPGDEDRTKGLDLDWDCDRDRLISRNSSLTLALNGKRLVMTNEGRNIRWRSLDKGDICQETLRSRRASEEFEVVVKPTLSAEEKAYLRWFYRTEEPTYWKFTLLALAFICLLIGFMLLGMGAMANKNRKKIAKYKAAAALLQKKDCDEVISLQDTGSAPTTPQAKPLSSPSSPSACPPPNGELGESRPGEILLTYKDGNTSTLYPEVAQEVKVTEGEEKEEEKEEKKENEEEERVEEEGEIAVEQSQSSEVVEEQQK